MIRHAIQSAQVEAMKAGDKPRLGAIRLMLAKIKERDIELRTAPASGDDDAVVVEVLQKMVKQRRESIALYESGNRPELAAAEAAEIGFIEAFLPRPLSDTELDAAIQAIVAETGAGSIKDMGRVVGQLKARHGSVIDMATASARVKAALGG